MEEVDGNSSGDDGVVPGGKKLQQVQGGNLGGGGHRFEPGYQGGDDFAVPAQADENERIFEVFAQKITDASGVIGLDGENKTVLRATLDKQLRAITNQHWLPQIEAPQDPLQEAQEPQDVTVDLSKLGLPTHLCNALWETLKEANEAFDFSKLVTKGKAAFIVTIIGIGGASIVVAFPTEELYKTAGDNWASTFGQQFNTTVPPLVTDFIKVSAQTMNISLNALGTTLAIFAFIHFMGRYLFTKLGNPDENELLTDKQKHAARRALKVIWEVSSVLALILIPSIIQGWMEVALRPAGTPVTLELLGMALLITVIGLPQMVLPVGDLHALTHTEHWNAIPKYIDTQLRILTNRFYYDPAGAMKLLNNFYAKIDEKLQSSEGLKDADVLQAMLTLNVEPDEKNAIVLHFQGKQLTRFGEFLELPVVGALTKSTFDTLNKFGVLAFSLFTATSSVDIMRDLGVESVAALIPTFAISLGITYTIYTMLYNNGVGGVVESLSSTQTKPGGLVPWNYRITAAFGLPTALTAIAIGSGPAGYDTWVKATLWIGSLLAGVAVTAANTNPFAKAVVNGPGFGAQIITPVLNAKFFKEFVDDTKVYVAKHFHFMTSDEQLQIALRFIGALRSNIDLLKEIPEANQAIIFKAMFTPDANGYYHPVTEQLFALWNKTMTKEGKQKLGQTDFFKPSTFKGIVDQNPSVLTPAVRVEADAKKWPKPARSCPTFVYTKMFWKLPSLADIGNAIVNGGSSLANRARNIRSGYSII